MNKNNKRVKISFIIPCYNVEKYLPKCIDSLMNQTLPDIEAIFINDGSPDNCLKILKDYRKKYGDKIVIVDKKNEGVWRGRKDGIKKAKGEFIGFVDELHIIPTKRWAAMPAKNCTVCGVEYVPGSGASRYCPACAKKIRREKSNESKRRSREQKRIACMNCPQKMTD